jgi:hypothetical protein
METKTNTDDSANINVESNYEGGTYYFSSAHDPTDNTSVHESPERSALAMFQLSAPTLTYANVK